MADSKLTIGESGNVGIGTKNPSEKLSIYGVNNTQPGVISLESSREDAQNTEVGLIRAKNGGGEIARISLNREGGSSTGFMSFHTKSTNSTPLSESMRIAANGSVGIGITNPKNTLDLGSATGSRGISWGGVDYNYANIWTKYSSGNLVLATGLYPMSNSEGFNSSHASNGMGKAAIELGAFTNGGDIMFYNNPPSNIPIGQAITPIESMRIKSNGNVGIGTTTPNTPLHVFGGNTMTHGWNKTSTLQAQYPVQIFNSSNTRWGGIGYDHSSAMSFWVNATSDNLTGTGTQALTILNDSRIGIGITPISKLDINGRTQFRDGADFGGGGTSNIGMITWGGSPSTFIMAANGTNAIGFNTASIERMRITPLGQVIIGIPTVPTIPTDYKLAVAGNIIAEKVKVKKQSSGWPDYVFAPTYKLQSLSEVEQFVKQNSHLPEIPSAKEIEAEGQDLGEMNRLLLKKVEELTLYLIQMDKKNKEQDILIQKLQIK